MFKDSKVIILALLCLYSISAEAQQVQWAATVEGFSTAYGRKAYSARQVLGKPNSWPYTGENACSWAPSRENNRGGEFVRVGFAEPQRVAQVVVGETLNPGSIAKIILYDQAGKKHEVYKQEEFRSRFSPVGKLFSHKFPLTSYQVTELKLVLRTDAVEGMNQIDAIGISDSDAPIEVQISELNYARYDGKAENLGPNVNSVAPDMLPMISPDGKGLYFARKQYRPNMGDEDRDDIYYSELMPDGNWSPAINVGSPLNNEHHNFVSAISPSGNSLLLPHDYKKQALHERGKRAALIENNKSFRISQSTKSGDKWSFPELLKIKDNYNKNEFTCIHMNTFGDVLLLAIEREDSHGDMDLYVSFKGERDEWSTPLNLGPEINTAASEGSVFLAADNRTIYFASKGYAGYGGFDMYMSRRLDESWTNWTQPLNLGGQINSARDDYYYTIPASGKYAYFSSASRNGEGHGMADIYRIPLPVEIQPEPATLISGIAIDALNLKPLEVEIRYRKQAELVPLYKETVKESNFKAIAPQRDALGLELEADGYFPAYRPLQPLVLEDEEWMDYDETDPEAVVEQTLREIMAAEPEVSPEIALADSLQNATPEVKAVLEQPTTVAQQIQELESKQERPELEPAYKEYYEDINLVPLEEGQVVRLNHIYFPANKSYLKKESQAELNTVAAFLMDHPNLVVEVGGHTNGLPSDIFCEELSNARAKRVVAYLVEKGVSKRQLKHKGYGKTKPVATNNTLEGRKQNQRVELTIISVR